MPNRELVLTVRLKKVVRSIFRTTILNPLSAPHQSLAPESFERATLKVTDPNCFVGSLPLVWSEVWSQLQFPIGVNREVFLWIILIRL